MSRPDGRSRKPGGTVSPSYLQLVRDNTPLPAPVAASPSNARHRIVIVPLDEPA
jgi:hypothetical protein